MLEKRTEFDSGSIVTQAVEGDAVETYGEEAFLHLVAIERKRTERSNRPFLLLLLDFKHYLGPDTDIAPSMASRLFAGLARGLRETDFVGWYRQGRVLGAVLTHFEDRAATEIASVVTDRLRVDLRGVLPETALQLVQVRAYQRPPGLNDRS
jgi:hypothetical protein